MKLVSREVRLTGNPAFTIYPIGDVHLGTIHCDKSTLFRDIAAIEADPNALWIGMGDYCECIVLSDPRFCAAEIDPEFRDKLDTLAVAQRDAFIKAVRPIAGKCLGLIDGNHELELKRRHYLDLTLDACRELGVEYLSDTAFVRIIFHRQDEEGGVMRTTNLLIYAEHGSGGGRKGGASVNRMEDLMGYFGADMYLSGHNHKRLVVPKVGLSVPRRGAMRLLETVGLGVYTGSYYRTYEEGTSSYGQRKSLSPTSLGCVPVRVDTRTMKLTALV